MNATDAWYLIMSLWGMIAAWAVIKGLSDE